MDPITLTLLAIGSAATWGARKLKKDEQAYLEKKNMELVLASDLEAGRQREDRERAKERDRAWEREQLHAKELAEARATARHKQDIRIQVNIDKVQIIIDRARKLGIADDDLISYAEQVLKLRARSDLDKLRRDL